MPAPKIEWTDELRAKVKQLWQDGKSSPEIANALGGEVTKNMVLGQLYYMGAMRTGKASNGVSPRAPKPRPTTYAKRSTARTPRANEVWGMEEDARRRKFAQKAARGARAQLTAIMAGQS